MNQDDKQMESAETQSDVDTSLNESVSLDYSTELGIDDNKKFQDGDNENNVLGPSSSGVKKGRIRRRKKDLFSKIRDQVSI